MKNEWFICFFVCLFFFTLQSAAQLARASNSRCQSYTCGAKCSYGASGVGIFFRGRGGGGREGGVKMHVYITGLVGFQWRLKRAPPLATPLYMGVNSSAKVGACQYPVRAKASKSADVSFALAVPRTVCPRVPNLHCRAGLSGFCSAVAVLAVHSHSRESAAP